MVVDYYNILEHRNIFVKTKHTNKTTNRTYKAAGIRRKRNLKVAKNFDWEIYGGKVYLYTELGNDCENGIGYII